MQERFREAEKKRSRALLCWTLGQITHQVNFLLLTLLTYVGLEINSFESDSISLISPVLA